MHNRGRRLVRDDSFFLKELPNGRGPFQTQCLHLKDAFIQRNPVMTRVENADNIASICCPNATFRLGHSEEIVQREFSVAVVPSIHPGIDGIPILFTCQH